MKINREITTKVNRSTYYLCISCKMDTEPNRNFPKPFPSGTKFNRTFEPMRNDFTFYLLAFYSVLFPIFHLLSKTEQTKQNICLNSQIIIK